MPVSPNKIQHIRLIRKSAEIIMANGRAEDTQEIAGRKNLQIDINLLVLQSQKSGCGAVG